MSANAKLHVRRSEQQLAILRDGLGAPILTQHARPDHRPFIHPLLAPDGRGVLTENEPPHHPWQHGLYAGLNDVNGIGFWTEGRHDKNRATDGSFHPQSVQSGASAIANNEASWHVVTEWRAPDGAATLAEEQRWSLVDRGITYFLTLDWSLEAQQDLSFGRYDYGGLFVRMPYRGEGEAINSEGLINAEAEGRQARWVAVSMPIANRPDWAGVALFDHPSNMRYPAPWRVDNQLGIAPSPCIAGSWRLAQGAAALFRYGVLVFCGHSNPEIIETHWQHFAKDIAS